MSELAINTYLASDPFTPAGQQLLLQAYQETRAAHKLKSRTRHETCALLASEVALYSEPSSVERRTWLERSRVNMSAVAGGGLSYLTGLPPAVQGLQLDVFDTPDQPQVITKLHAGIVSAFIDSFQKCAAPQTSKAAEIVRLHRLGANIALGSLASNGLVTYPASLREERGRHQSAFGTTKWIFTVESDGSSIAPGRYATMIKSTPHKNERNYDSRIAVLYSTAMHNTHEGTLFQDILASVNSLTSFDASAQTAQLTATPRVEDAVLESLVAVGPFTHQTLLLG